jgi:hypothetical protein
MRRIGAKNLFIIRHGERLDNVNLSWRGKAIRPQDTPLSNMGHEQAKRLGKWLYSKIPIQTSTKIFCSPFIRCVQTAHGIASQLESLQNTGTFSSNIADICIEPGICEDPWYMNGLACNQPWFLNAADLMGISNLVKLDYDPIRQVQFKVENGLYVEDGGEYHEQDSSISVSDERLNSIVHEIIEHPYVEDGGTAIIVTHAKPSVDMLRSLAPVIDGIGLPPYEMIKKGHYDGPPIQYTACTHMVHDDETDQWVIKKDSHLFSNEHDPNLKYTRQYKMKKLTRVVYDEELLRKKERYFTNPHNDMGCDETKKSGLQVATHKIKSSELADAKPGDVLTILRRDGNNTTPLTFKIPTNYNNGDKLIVKYLTKAYEVSDANNNINGLNGFSDSNRGTRGTDMEKNTYSQKY